MLLPILLSGQPKCSCPEPYNYEKNEADKVYQYRNGKTIGLCGYSERQNSYVVYAEFVLVDCFSNKILGEWGANQTCSVIFENDTLIVSELFNFPVGRNFKYMLSPFHNYKFFTTEKDFSKTGFYNTDCVYYNNEQVKISIDKFHRTIKGNTEDNINIAERLFCSYVSGSTEAEHYLKEVPLKLGPFDGAIAEQWNILWDLYLQYSKSLQTN